MADGGIELVVFADDWGRHPSSAQHLIRHLPGRDVLWVNTVGTRRPRLADLRRIGGVLRNWASRRPPVETPPNVRVMSPRMYPGFRTGWQRRLNARLLAGAVNGALRGAALPVGAAHGPTRVAVTTLPITADLVGKLDVDRWVYYCVDDFSVWPGLDSDVMQTMERELVAKVDAVVCVSEVLRERVRGIGREADLLTHGVDEAAWRTPAPSASLPRRWDHHKPLTATFWGLIDERFDHEWAIWLTGWREIQVNCVGPLEDCTLPRFLQENGVKICGPVRYRDLPAVAAASDVLVMPYRDLPVTRAMQPLKLLEYLATYKPVVVRDLPATRAWADCCDVVSTADDFVRLCVERAKTGLPPEQKAARDRRLPGESWSEKARRFEQIVLGHR